MTIKRRTVLKGMLATGASVDLIAVEPEGAAKAAAALRAGAPVTLEAPASIADGLIPPSVGRLPFADLG